MFQLVIDTNVLVAALLSNRGASHRLLRLVGDHRWRINLSVPLVLEYEQTLKRVCAGGILSSSDIDNVIHFLCANANLRPIFFLWRPFLPDPKDDLSWNWLWKAGPISWSPSTREISWVRSASAFERSRLGNSLR
jgi:predicted nucleic acid-binding protein